MYGYVRPLPDELKGKDFRRWKQDYCGLCRCLGRRYGLAARFLLNYDMTFLCSLLSAGRQRIEESQCRCPGRFFRRRPCRAQDGALEYAADLTVLLFCGKLEDELRDGGLLRRLGARLLLLLFRRAHRKAAALRENEARVIEERLAALSKLEQERCPSIDRSADEFASILRCFADYFEDEEDRRAARWLLYHVGRFVYLTDALDDLARDCRRGSYNPLRDRFKTSDGALSEEDRRALLETIDASVTQATAAFELLPKGNRSAVTENILYCGLPAVLKAVADGSFHRRKRVES